MDILTLDVETFYSTEYSLSRMSPPEYILDARYECTGLAVKLNDNPAYWVEGDRIQEFFDSQSEDVIAVSHNALFDMPVFAWRYGWVPRVMLDTLGVARATLQKDLRSLSLDSVAKHLGLGGKTGALANVKNMRLDQIRAHPDLYKSFIEYGINDADLCYGIYVALVKSGIFPVQEIAVMDAVLRCAVQPQFVTNVELLQQSLATIKTEKEQTLAAAGVYGADKKALMSNDQFAQLLRQHGVEPPTKISGTTGKETYAFAKSDQDFLDLLDHPSHAIQTLVSTRLGHKSTIEESRHERFINIAQLEWPKTKRNLGGYQRLMPMPLKFSGAHTHRLSGDWKMNVQNMGRGSTLRQALGAPEGYTVVTCDESQVEARFVVTLCGQEDVRLQFENDEDVYRLFAAVLFNKHPNDITKLERFLGKQCILGLGYQLGAPKFTRSIPILAWNQLGLKLDYTLEEGQLAVNTYRSRNHAVQATWRLLQKTGIRALITGDEWQWGPVLFRQDEIVLPNGLNLYYKNIRTQEGGMYGSETVFEYGGKTKYLYGGKVLENCLSATTEVLTLVGWKAIVDVAPDDLVWDGMEWVSHGGVTSEGNNDTAPLDGVRMTNDHEVLAQDGWVRAAQAGGLHRKEVRLPDSVEGCWYDGAETVMGSRVPLWEQDGSPLIGTGKTPVMRVHEEKADRNQEQDPRHVATPSVLGMEIDARPMPAADAPCVPQLRGSGHNGLREVEELRSLLAGHGRDIPSGWDIGADRQQQGVYTGQLPLGEQDRPSTEQAFQPNGGHSERSDAVVRGSSTFGHWGDDPSISYRSWVEAGRPVSETFANEPTYDLLNCGPRNRFVVRGDNGPFIVHNCVQALARIVTMEAAVRVRARLAKLKIPLALQVHDELVFVVRNEYVEVTRMVVEHEMRVRPAWLPNIPLNCESGVGPTYGSAK